MTCWGHACACQWSLLLQEVARTSGVLLWSVYLAVDGREPTLRATARLLLKVMQ
jgi:hypothetical protein